MSSFQVRSKGQWPADLKIRQFFFLGESTEWVPTVYDVCYKTSLLAVTLQKLSRVKVKHALTSDLAF